MLDNNTIKIIVLAVLTYIVYLFLTGSNPIKNTGILQMVPQFNSSVPSAHVHDDVYKTNPNVLAHPQMSNPMVPAPMNDVQPHELLPREGGFAESNPMGQGHLSHKNFFESGHHPGLNTQSSTMKNPNLQLRSDPLIERRDVGPWNQSTVEADGNRRQFDIGDS